MNGKANAVKQFLGTHRRKLTTVAAVGTVSAIAFVPSAVAGPANSVTSFEVVNHSLNTIDMDTATHNLYSRTIPGADQVSNSSQIAPKTIDETDLNDAAKAKLNAVGTPGPKGDPGEAGKDGTDGAKGEKGDPASDAKGAVLVSDDFEAKLIANCGGSFKTQKTKLGEFTLPAGQNLKVDSYMFAARTVSGADTTVAQLALRIGATETAFGDDRGTVLTPLPAFKNREITGQSFWVGNNAAAVKVEVFGFCYNDDADGSSAGGGEFSIASRVAVTQG